VSGGGLMKYLLVLLVVGVGLWLLSARFRTGSKEPKDSKSAPGPGSSGGEPAAPGASGGSTSGRASDQPAASAPRQMVACNHCGVHLPADEAVYADQVPYCGAAHLQAGRPR
jgi:uncharacterized protein